MSAITRTSPTPEPLTPAVFHVLLALAVTDRHGYGIMKQAETDSGGAIKMGPGTLYGTIKRLLEAGLIAESEERVDATLDDNRRRYYQITPAGRQTLSLELERFEHILQAAKNISYCPATGYKPAMPHE